jgi:Rieske Fe-S protein
MTTQPVEGAGRGDARAMVTSRRTLFAGAGAFGAGALLAACGDGDDPADGDGDREEGVLAEVGEVEVGGGHINASENVVVTQPTEGDFRGFSAICTHQGCTVAEVSGGTINCACHGSRYSIEDGSVVQSAPELTPETQNPLPPVDVTEQDGAIVRA